MRFRLKNWISLTFLMLGIQLGFSSMECYASERFLVRTQWRTGNIAEPNITFFSPDEAGPSHLVTGMNLKEEELAKDLHGLCGFDNILQKVTRFPLEKMLERGFLNREQFEFYKKFGDALDPEQVVFFNLATPAARPEINISTLSMNADDPFGIKKTYSKVLMENFTVFGKNALTDEEFIRESSKILETEATLWLVRDYATDLSGNIVRKDLPWQFEPELKKAINIPHNGGLNFELGRASAEIAKDTKTLFNKAILTAANDVIATGKNLAASKVYVHALSPIHLRYYKSFGFLPLHALENGETLMVAKLEDLLHQSNPLKDLHETTPYLPILKNDITETLKFRNRVRSSMTQMLDPVAGTRKSPLVISYQKDWYAFMADDLGKMTDEERNAFIINSSATPDIFAQSKLPSHVLNHEIRGNHVYGLDPLQLSEDPQYLSKTISGIYMHFVNELNKGQLSRHLGQSLIHESPLVLHTTDVGLVENAKKLGAEVTESVSIKRSRKMGSPEVVTIEEKTYALTFTNQKVKAISAYHFQRNDIPEFHLGKFHTQFLKMNGL